MTYNSEVLEQLYLEIKPILIKDDGSLVSMDEAKSKHPALFDIAARFMRQYEADTIEEVFDAYNRTVVKVLQDARIIPREQCDG